MDTVSSTPKARVRHWCEVCGWVIEPGEIYQRAVTFDGGDVLTWKAHIDPCQTASNRAWLDGYSEGGDYITADSIAEWATDRRGTDGIAAEIERRLTINYERARVRRVAALAGKESDR